MNKDIKKHAAKGGSRRSRPSSRKVPVRFDAKLQEMFLSRLREGTANEREICRGLNIGRSTPYSVASRDPEFKRQFQEAKRIREEVFGADLRRSEECLVTLVNKKLDHLMTVPADELDPGDLHKLSSAQNNLNRRREIMVHNAVEMDVEANPDGVRVSFRNFLGMSDEVG